MKHKFSLQTQASYWQGPQKKMVLFPFHLPESGTGRRPASGQYNCSIIETSPVVLPGLAGVDGTTDTPTTRFITYHRTIPMPTSWQTTSCIQNQACCRWVPRESGCTGGMELSPCPLLVQQAVFHWYSESVWHTEPVSCGQAHIQFKNQWNPSNLDPIKKFNNQHNINNYNNHNKIRQYIMTIMTIVKLITIFTINRIVIYFQDCHFLPLGHSQMFWTRCWFVLWQNKRAKTFHTNLNLVSPRRIHCQFRCLKSNRLIL